MITTTAWVCASMAAGDLESPRLVIEFLTPRMHSFHLWQMKTLLNFF